jgi:hypothetical protein
MFKSHNLIWSTGTAILSTLRSTSWYKVANYDACSHRQQVKQLFLHVSLLTNSKFFVHSQNRINTSITNRYNKTEQSYQMSLPFLHVLIALVGLGFLISEVSRSYLDTPQSGGLHWLSNQPITETPTWHHTTLTGDRHSWPWQDMNCSPSMWVAADPHLWPQGHWDQHRSQLLQ